MGEVAASEVQELADALIPEAEKLAQDAHGSVVLMKLFSCCDKERKHQLVQQLLPGIHKPPPGLANEAHGCRVVQHLVREAPRELQALLADALRDQVMECVESMHGNHVIQKCIEQMPPDTVSFIVQAVEEDPALTAKHAYGCRVIQRLLEHCSMDQLSGMLDKLVLDLAALAKHRFGNYVVQHMLDHGRLGDKRKIIAIVRENIVEFSQSRCASNVVEKCFEISTSGVQAGSLEEDRRLLMQSVLGEAADSNPPLLRIVDDKFGNYIVQKVIELSRESERDRLREQLRRVQHWLRRSANGKHILSRMEISVSGGS